jgi:hypothetical protein
MEERQSLKGSLHKRYQPASPGCLEGNVRPTTANAALNGLVLRYRFEIGLGSGNICFLGCG